MTVVLMDNHRHKTVQLPFEGVAIQVPVSSYGWGVEYAEFKAGGMLFGDPVFYQVRGPELPEWWWERFDPMRACYRMDVLVSFGP